MMQLTNSNLILGSQKVTWYMSIHSNLNFKDFKIRRFQNNSCQVKVNLTSCKIYRLDSKIFHQDSCREWFIYKFIIIKACWKHGFPWLSLTIYPYQSSLFTSLLDQCYSNWWYASHRLPVCREFSVSCCNI